MKTIVVVSLNFESIKLCEKIKSCGFNVVGFRQCCELEFVNEKQATIYAAIFDIENFAEGDWGCSIEKLQQSFGSIPLFLSCENQFSDFEKKLKAYGIKGLVCYSDDIHTIKEKLLCLELTNKEEEPPFPKELDMLVGSSAAINELKKSIMRASKTDLPIILLGETGSGKNLTASIIHALSARSEFSYVGVNTARIPTEICESELFGSAKGAFTGAVDKKGLFEQADAGTLFLDEIGTLSRYIQAKMLTVIDEGRFSRVGETVERSVNVRIISATNIPLKELTESMRMRSDFYYRLSGDRIIVPPLRERYEDIPSLAEYFLQSKQIFKKLSVAALTKLYKHEWKGNIREFKNTLVLAATKSDSSVILSSDIVFF